MENKSLIDIHYLIAKPELCKLSAPQTYHSQSTWGLKEKWKLCSTMNGVPQNIKLHSMLAFVGNIPAEKELELNFLTIERYGPLNLDFDHGKNPVLAIRELKDLATKLFKMAGGPDGISVYVSGKKGGGIFLDSRLMGVSPHPKLALFYKEMARQLCANYGTADLSIYKERRGQLTRVFNGRLHVTEPGGRIDRSHRSVSDMLFT